MNPLDSLLQRAYCFDEEALAELYDHYSAILYGYAMRQLGDGPLAEECVAETFSRFLTGLRNGQGPQEHLRAYLYRLAHNWITDHYHRQPPPALPREAEAHTAAAVDAHAGPSLQAEQEKMRTTLLLLTAEQRQVIVLRFLEDQSNEEVALALGKPASAVKDLQHRALLALRRILVPGNKD